MKKVLILVAIAVTFYAKVFAQTDTVITIVTVHDTVRVATVPHNSHNDSVNMLRSFPTVCKDTHGWCTGQGLVEYCPVKRKWHVTDYQYELSNMPVGACVKVAHAGDPRFNPGYNHPKVLITVIGKMDGRKAYDYFVENRSGQWKRGDDGYEHFIYTTPIFINLKMASQYDPKEASKYYYQGDLQYAVAHDTDPTHFDTVWEFEDTKIFASR